MQSSELGGSCKKHVFKESAALVAIETKIDVPLDTMAIQLNITKEGISSLL